MALNYATMFGKQRKETQEPQPIEAGKKAKGLEQDQTDD
jgi:hypothetical protein